MPDVTGSLAPILLILQPGDAVVDPLVVAVTDWRSEELWARYRRGDRATLEAIYWELVGAVEHVLAAGFITKDGRSAVPRVANPDRRADLLQEVFLKAFSNTARASFDPKLDYRRYLFAIARNSLVDHHRRERRLLRPLAVMDQDGRRWARGGRGPGCGQDGR